MDPAAVLAAFDRQMRADPPPEAGVERAWADGVLRTTGAYNLIGWWDFDAAAAPAIAAREAACFAGRHVEWKVYSHDAPANLESALRDAGFVAAERETFLVLDIEAGLPDSGGAGGFEIRQVDDAAGVADLVAVREAAFGSPVPGRADELIARLGDPAQALFVAYEDGEPVSAGRLELPPGRAFAGLYGGGTVPGRRSRGVYRALVASRAAQARRRGYRHLFVEALETSRPILERLGFQSLATVRGWELSSADPVPASPPV
jgi:GNAT superfamily N-acetyltransferase